jgi:hypothetical protein
LPRALKCWGRERSRLTPQARCRSGPAWEGTHVTVDSDTAVEQCEIAAGHIAAMIKTRIKLFGGFYRVWVSESLPGHKLKISVWYAHNTNGAPFPLRPFTSCSLQ